MYIHGLSLSGYRSFGNEQTLLPTDMFNIIIGKNNAGKSNIIRALVFLLPQLAKNQKQPNAAWIEGLDKHNRADVPTALGLLMPVEKIGDFLAFGRTGHSVNTWTSRLLASIESSRLEGIWGYKVRHDSKWSGAVDPRAEVICSTAFPGNQLEHATVELTGSAERYGDDNYFRSNSARIFSRIDPFRFDYKTILIPAARSTKFQVNQGSGIEDNTIFFNGVADFGGAGLIERIFKFQNPTFEERDHAKKFRELLEFTRAVVGNQTAMLQVPHDKTGINLEVDGQILPLASYGSGVEQIVIVAAGATAVENHIICLEEPETNLHPEYQIRLLDYLRNKTKNQYFVTTHSHSVIDLDRANVFSVRLQNGASLTQRLLDQADRYDVVFDLGYRASDIAQCNSIIWVEGPSDRIYLKVALHEIAPDLIEGTDFSIMFYGGRLLSHVSADDAQIDEFILLTRINRRSAILIDSDRKKATDQINATKLRVSNEFKQRDLFVWITEGREIENYIDAKLFREEVDSLWPGQVSARLGRYEDVCKLTSGNGLKSSVDKVKLAHRISKKMAIARFRFDWNDKVRELIGFIRASN